MRKLKRINRPDVTVQEFVEIVLMWHCAGNIPMDRSSTAEFIEDPDFSSFLMSIAFWAKRFGMAEPSRSEIVKALHTLYEEQK